MISMKFYVIWPDVLPGVSSITSYKISLWYIKDHGYNETNVVFLNYLLENLLEFVLNVQNEFILP